MTVASILTAGLIVARIEFFEAFRTEAVAELSLGMSLNIFLEPAPGFLVIADFMAMHADGQNTLKPLNMIEGVFELDDSVCQVVLQFNDPFAHFNACTQFLTVKRFGEVIAGARFESNDDVFGAS